MSGGPAKEPTLPDIRRLLAAAANIEGPAAATLALSILTLGLTWEITAIEVQDIDWAAKAVRVPRRGGTSRRLVLNAPALALITRLVGDAREGQVITACRGTRYTPDAFRLDRVRSALSKVAPEIAQIEWTMHGIRRSGARNLFNARCEREEIRAMLGLEPSDFATWAERQATKAADVWANLLS